MGWFTWFWDSLNYLGLTATDKRILFLGLDNGGKTTLLRLLTDDQLAVQRPTMQPEIQTFRLADDTKIQISDMSGIRRRINANYYVGFDGVVFVVDASCPDRFAEAKADLESLLQNEELAGLPVVILGNKIDVAGCASQEVLKKALGIVENDAECTPLVKSGNSSKNDDDNNGNDESKKMPGAPPSQRCVKLFMCSVVRRHGYGIAIQWLAQHFQKQM